MRTTLIDCDKCGRRVEAPSAAATLTGVGSLRDLSADLCEPCVAALRDWLRGPPKSEGHRP
jgi:hypothetical protein